jgi:hypothetical protein
MFATLTRWFPLVAAALALSAQPLSADDSKPGVPPAQKKMENPTFVEWSRWKVGAFVEMTTDQASLVSGARLR